MGKTLKITATTALLGFALLSQQIVFAWNEPDGFRELKWDSSVSDFLRVFSTATEKTDAIDNSLNGRRFALQESIGKASVLLMFYFVQDKFKIVQLIFSPTAYKELADVFRARYGVPLVERTQELFWNGQKAYIILGQTMRDDPSHGYAVIAQQGSKYMGQRREIELKEAAGGL